MDAIPLTIVLLAAVIAVLAWFIAQAVRSMDRTTARMGERVGKSLERIARLILMFGVIGGGVWWLGTAAFQAWHDAPPAPAEPSYFRHGCHDGDHCQKWQLKVQD
jgi:hypothetical protein